LATGLLWQLSRFSFGQADDGLCSTCSVPETIHHFLLQCPVFDMLRSTFLDTLTSLGIRQTVTDILSNPCCFDALFSFISASGRKM